MEAIEQSHGRELDKDAPGSHKNHVKYIKA